MLLKKPAPLEQLAITAGKKQPAETIIGRKTTKRPDEENCYIADMRSIGTLMNSR